MPEIQIPAETVEQFAMFMQRRDAIEQGYIIDGVARPTWDEISLLGGHETYVRDAAAYIGALVHLVFRPIESLTDDDAEVLRVAVGGVLFNVSNFPEKVQTRLLGQDMAPLREKLAAAVLAAGFRRQSSVTDAEVEAGMRSWFDATGSFAMASVEVKDRNRPRMRAALEAARKVRR